MILLVVRVQKSGAVTIPKAMREQLGLKPGSSKVSFSSDGRNLLFAKAEDKCLFCGEAKRDKLIKIGNGAICSSCLVIANDRKMKVIDSDIKKAYEMADKVSYITRENNRFKVELNSVKKQLKQELVPVMLTYPSWDIVKIYGVDGVIEARTVLNLNDEEFNSLIGTKEILNFKSGVIRMLLRELVLGRYHFPEEKEKIGDFNSLYSLRRLDIRPEDDISKRLYTKNIYRNQEKEITVGYYLLQLFQNEETIHQIRLYLSDRVLIDVLLNNLEWFRIRR